MIPFHAAPATDRAPLVLTLKAGGRDFGFGILALREMLRVHRLERVSWGPRYMRGVVVRHGTVIPVLDFSELLGEGPAAVTRRTCVVIVEIGPQGAPMTIGALVDAPEVLPEWALRWVLRRIDTRPAALPNAISKRYLRPKGPPGCARSDCPCSAPRSAGGSRRPATDHWRAVRGRGA